jgi:hypothetical protein
MRIVEANHSVILRGGQEGKHPAWVFPYSTQTSTKAWRDAVQQLELPQVFGGTIFGTPGQVGMPKMERR